MDRLSRERPVYVDERSGLRPRCLTEVRRPCRPGMRNRRLIEPQRDTRAPVIAQRVAPALARPVLGRLEPGSAVPIVGDGNMLIEGAPDGRIWLRQSRQPTAVPMPVKQAMRPVRALGTCGHQPDIPRRSDRCAEDAVPRDDMTHPDGTPPRSGPATIRARWSGGRSLRARAGQASYAAYFLHPLVLTAIMVAFGSLALAPELKFLIVAVLAVPACFLAGYALTRLPRISRALLTAGQPAARARSRPTMPDIPRSTTPGAAPATRRTGRSAGLSNGLLARSPVIQNRRSERLGDSQAHRVSNAP